ncbi:glycerol kinase [Tardiphaga sp. vice154]|uniref:FGGY family carbohydrate kinase n=1 Tax=Tardiphaga sp. vice154 TaxID=2592814 RepID=UPI0011657E33|nr:FGGY family carbohydrate kinase [Tardiphaga sp. vice154]QDM22695.1 glycerol kinase [Tardiphaga sp. vice154]
MAETQKDVILAVDEGTSGTRAATVSHDGNVSCLEYLPLLVDTPRPGVVEQDANAILEKTLAACLATIARSVAEGQRIVALALATQRATAVLWDRNTGRALVPAMVWQDSRYVGLLDQLAPTWDKILTREVGRPGGVRSPYIWAAQHLLNTPAIIEAYDEGRLCFGTIDTWLLWHLTNDRIHVTTPTNATSAGAYVLAEHRYHPGWLAALQFPQDLLPVLRSDADSFGRTNVSLLGIDVPILASMGDQHAGALGLECLDRGQAMCIHGTGSFVDLITGPTPPVNIGLYDGTTTMVARRSLDTSRFAVETFVATTGSALDWVCEKLRWFESATEISRLAAEAKSARGVTFLPALTGLRVPKMQANARASLTGISIASTRSEIAFAILEGIAHSVTTCLKANEEVSGVDVSELIVGGGLSTSDTLLQIQADLIGRPIRRKPNTARATLRGVAYLAGSTGLQWDVLKGGTTPGPDEQVFEPAISADHREQRRALWHSRIKSELEHADTFGAGQSEY